MQDCNYCNYINITEKEQNYKKTKGVFVPHICLKYNKRVIHRSSRPNHSEYLYPCEECIGETYD